MSDHDLLVKIDEKLDAVHEDVAVLKEKVVQACSEVDDIKIELYGNGRNGLKADLNEHLTRHDERNKLFKVLASVGSATGISGLLTAIFK